MKKKSKVKSAAKPAVKAKKSRKMVVYWHFHHHQLLERIKGGHDAAKQRRLDIYDNKPVEQRPIRLLLFQPVRGRLPDAVLANISRDCYWSTRISDKDKNAVYIMHSIECQSCCPMRNGGQPEICPGG
jgi:hypothetical protein